VFFRFVLFVASFCLLGSECHAAGRVHKSPMAGRWFPATQIELRTALEKAFGSAAQRAGGSPGRKQLLGLIAPHAGIQYSGVVAASAYRALGKPANVIVLGFSHSRVLEGVVAPDIEAYQTPLGKARVNAEVIRDLGFATVPESEVCDHSLENQLPFIQFAAPQASLTPLYVGNLSEPARISAARRIAARIQKGDVVIASSDFTHYGKMYGYVPFANDAKLPGHLADRARQAFEEIGSLHVPAFDSYLEQTGDTICGRDPIRLLMEVLGHLDVDAYPQLIDYMTSGELMKDYSMSVGYAALAFYPPSAFEVATADQEKLLTSARLTLERYYGGLKQHVPVPPEQRSGDVLQRSGVFVTIRKNGELRGCIGTLSPRSALWQVVPDRTLAASFSDPRFRALSREEEPVTLEISLLTPLKKIRNWQSFRLGQGAVLVKEGNAATLLPQVAEEMGWTRRQFLENLARKAGLSGDGYRDPKARLYVFEAQVFAEAGGQPANGHTGGQ
jgi:AmmeMemoRadiSam system protein B/AmmeMemoRadiSam system protein A